MTSAKSSQAQWLLQWKGLLNIFYSDVKEAQIQNTMIETKINLDKTNFEIIQALTNKIPGRWDLSKYCKNTKSIIRINKKLNMLDTTYE